MLLLLFHPRSAGTPAPTPTPAEVHELPQGGGAVFSHHQRRKQMFQRDEDELIELLGLIVPLLGRK